MIGYNDGFVGPLNGLSGPKGATLSVDMYTYNIIMPHSSLLSNKTGPQPYFWISEGIRRNLVNWYNTVTMSGPAFVTNKTRSYVGLVPIYRTLVKGSRRQHVFVLMCLR